MVLVLLGNYLPHIHGFIYYELLKRLRTIKMLGAGELMKKTFRWRRFEEFKIASTLTLLP